MSPTEKSSVSASALDCKSRPQLGLGLGTATAAPQKPSSTKDLESRKFKILLYTTRACSTEKITLCQFPLLIERHTDRPTDREHKTPACPETFCRVSLTHDFQWSLGAAASLKVRENAAPGDCLRFSLFINEPNRRPELPEGPSHSVQRRFRHCCLPCNDLSLMIVID